MSWLIAIALDEANLPAASPEAEQERRAAIHDLLEDNSFTLVPREGRETPPGPYRLRLAMHERRLLLAIATDSGEPVGEVQLALGPFRQVVKDYFQICESYFEAVRRLAPGQIEAIDMARRGIHNEGARLLAERLEGKIALDRDTARGLFTLICALPWGG